MDKETKDKFLKALMEETYEKVYIFISRKERDRDFVEDVVQETFMEAYKKADLLMNHPNPMAWLYLTARNKMMKMRAKRKEICILDNGEVDLLEDLKAGEGEYGEIELATVIKDSVSETDYEMLCDYYVNGYSSTEIADKYGLEKSGVRMKISRLKRKLRGNIIAGWLLFVICIWGL